MQKLLANRRLQTGVKISSLLIMAAAACVAFACFKTEIAGVLVFIAFLIFGVLLPGCFVLDNAGVKSGHLSTYLARGFFAGFALNILIYYLSALTGLRGLLFLLLPLLSVLWIIRFFRSGGKSSTGRIKEYFEYVPAGFFFFAACVFVCSMLATQYDYIAPAFSLFSLMPQDFGFHAGIINALAEGYPPKNPWIEGRIINYHYYTEMLFSVPVRLLGLTSDNILMTCTPYFVTPVFCVSLYSAFRELMPGKNRAGLYCLAFHFSNMFMLKRFTDSWLLYHIYSNINSAGLGLACFLTAIALLREWDDADSRTSSPGWGTTMYFAALVMLMTGIKGPVALVLVCGMTGTLILAFILKKGSRRLAGFTGLALIAFCLIYIYVLGGEHSNASGGAVLNLGEVTDLFFLKIPVVDSIQAMGLPRSAGLAVMFVIFVFFYLTAFFVPLIVGFIREFVLVITKKKDFVFSSVCIYACFTVGFISLMLLNFSGHSQVYFGFAASVLVPFIAFRLFEDIRENSSTGAKFVRGSFAVMMAFFALTMIIYTCSALASVPAFLESKGEGLEKYRNLSADEYEGLIWLRDNTDPDSLCASDRFNSVSMEDYDYTKRNNNTHFAYAIYSQRRQYLEGSGFSLEPDQNNLRKEMLDNNSELYDPENENRGAAAKALGIDYVIVSKRFGDRPDLSNDDYELCFTNDDMDIYRVVYRG